MRSLFIATLTLVATLGACGTKMSPVTLTSGEPTAEVDAPTIVAQLATLDIKATVIRAAGKEIALTVSNPARVRALASDLFRPRRLIIAPFADDQSPLTSLSEAEAASNTRTDSLLGQEQTPMPVWDDEGALTAFLQRLRPEVAARVVIGRYPQDLSRTVPTRTGWVAYLLATEEGLDNRDIARASIVTDDYGDEPTRRLVAELTPSGAAAFADLTQALIGQPLSVTIDGKMVSAPTIMTRIDGGRVEISLPDELTPEEWETQASSLGAALSHPHLTSTWKLAP